MAFLAHNAEEALLDLPVWSAAHSPARWTSWGEHPGRFEIAVGALSLVVIALAIWVTTRKPAWSKPALQVFAVIMLVNVVTHISLSVMTGSAMPGLTTALIVIAPMMTGILWLLARHS